MQKLPQAKQQAARIPTDLGDAHGMETRSKNILAVTESDNGARSTGPVSKTDKAVSMVAAATTGHTRYVWCSPDFSILRRRSLKLSRYAFTSMGKL